MQIITSPPDGKFSLSLISLSTSIIVATSTIVVVAAVVAIDIIGSVFGCLEHRLGNAKALTHEPVLCNSCKTTQG